jgi:hypothetical protein
MRFRTPTSKVTSKNFFFIFNFFYLYFSGTLLTFGDFLLSCRFVPFRMLPGWNFEGITFERLLFFFVLLTKRKLTFRFFFAAFLLDEISKVNFEIYFFYFIFVFLFNERSLTFFIFFFRYRKSTGIPFQR